MCLVYQMGWRKDGWRMGGLVKSVKNGGVGAKMVDERWLIKRW